MTAGDIIRIHDSGTVTTVAILIHPRLYLRFGGTAFKSTAATSPLVASRTGNQWMLDAWFTVVAVGASGSVEGSGSVQWQNRAIGMALAPFAGAQPGVRNTTVALPVDVAVRFGGTTAAGTSLVLRQSGLWIS